ncbi:MAG: glycerol-3-phosphate 1-O-acyltransferase PlsY [Candidatus Omnitrophica bacterium]|nr:glycerol-3-phosphate 1-O-acyltransferase PlsY [Candidatus Omnitrophota bacterium]
MLWIILGIIVSYFIGSTPTAYLAGKLLKGIDIRKHGSGNVGATNALRVLGKRAGIIVLLIDCLKGVIPVVFISDIILSKMPGFNPELVRILFGVSSILGHNWTVFLNFKGGKGVATTFGVLIGLSFRIQGFALILGLVILSWFVTFFISRIVSLASLVSALIFPVLAIFLNHSRALLIFSLLTASFIIVRHKSNLKRLLQGKEPRLSFKKK